MSNQIFIPGSDRFGPFLMIGDFRAAMPSVEVARLLASAGKAFTVQEQESWPPDKVAGHLLVGTNGAGEVVVHHQHMQVDANGWGYLVFSPRQARGFAKTVLNKADEAEAGLS